MPKVIRFVYVGKLKSGFWREAQAHYVKRLKPYLTVQETIVKDAASGLSPQERNRVEGQGLLKAIDAQDRVICLDERGQTLDSPGLAEMLRPLMEDANQKPCFVIGGPYGLAQPVLDRAQTVLSLGTMTFPHELARVMLFEQLYRAVTILRGMPYHHA